MKMNFRKLAFAALGLAVVTSNVRAQQLPSPQFQTLSPSDNSNHAATTAFVHANGGGGGPAGVSGQIQTNNGNGGFGALSTGTSGPSVVLQTNSSGLVAPAVLPPATTSALGAVQPDGTTIIVSGGVISATGGGGGGGGVSGVSVVPANGLTGSVANPTSTPAITLGTSVTGVVKGDGAGFGAATPGVDYLAPAGSGSALTGLTWGQLGGTPTTLGGYGVPVTGTGSAVQANSPTLVAPTLGTPIQLNLANASNLAASALVGNIAIANLASGANANGTTFLAGDNTWKVPTGVACFGVTNCSASLGTGTTSLNGAGVETDFHYNGPNWAPTLNELQISTNNPGGNVFALRNSACDGYAAITARDISNNESGAFWHGSSADFGGTGSISGNTLTVTSVSCATVSLNGTVALAGVAPGTYVTANLTGTGGVGTYTVSGAAQTVAEGPMNLYLGGANFETSCLSSPSFPCARPPRFNLRQTFQDTASHLIFRNMIDIDANSRIGFILESTCNSQVQRFGAQLSFDGQFGICVSSLIPGVGLQVASGASVFSRGITNCPQPTDCTGADAMVMNTSAGIPTFRMTAIGARKWDLKLNPTPNRVDAIDTDGAGVIPWSFGLDGRQTFTVGGIGSNQGRVGTFLQTSTTNFSVAGDAQAARSLMRGAGTASLRVTVNGSTAGKTLNDGDATNVHGNCFNIPDNSTFGGIEIRFAATDTSARGNSYSAVMPNGILDRQAGIGTTVFVGGVFANEQHVGANTYTVPTATQDATNGCINVSWTPPNSHTWRAVAEIRDVEVQ